MIDAALLLLRSVSGGLLAGHGAQKLFGAFEGPGRQGTTGMMGKLGLEPAGLWAHLAGGAELAGGVLTAAGFLGPVGPVTALGPMAIATTMAHWGRPIWVTKGGAELPVTDAAIFGALALAGPGRYSVDEGLGIRMPRWVGAVAFAGVAGGTVAAHLMRRTQQPAPPQQEQAQAAAGPATQVEDREVELRASGQRSGQRQPQGEPAG